MVVGYKLNDYIFYIYKIDNYGKCWKCIDEGFFEDVFVCVVCEDIECEGMLFVGIESGMFISFDDGKYW